MRFDFDQRCFIDTDNGQTLPAGTDARQTLSWQALHDEVDAWIDQARRAGVQAGVPLVIVGHKEAGFLVAMLGCLMLGVPFVPVDAINPVERQRRIVDIVRAAVIHDAASGSFAAGCADPAPLAEPDIAYIMFTSGSTGDPKGVQIGTDSLALFAGWIRDCLTLGPAPAFMDQMLFSFDFSLFNVAGALVTGGSCVLCAREIIADHAAFIDYLARSKVSVWASTPSFIRQQLLAPGFNQAGLPDLRVFVFGAESLTPALAETLWQRFPGIRIINSYGPTEATCSTTWVEIDDALRRAAPNPFPIGRAKPYAEVFLQDGEICVAGDHVMRGYINRPDLNQTLLFRHNGKRAYHTGDLGQIDEHGLVTFRGRIDDQIKLHGYRIELAEVDAALTRLPGVRAGATIALKRPDGSALRMVGFIETEAPLPVDDGLHPLPDGMHDWKTVLGERLPTYMIPSELIACAGFPTTPTDKVDRKKLEQRYLAARLSKKQES